MMPAEGRAAESFPLTRRGAIAFSLGAAALLSVLSVAITIFYRKQSLLAVFAQGSGIAIQILVGLALGAVGATAVAASVLHAPVLGSLRRFLGQHLAALRPTTVDIVIVSLAAGFSEELFFRGTLQPLWGIWVASLAFALAHVGGNVFTWTKACFTAYVFVVGLLFGLLNEHVGLVAAMSAHVAFDLVFLVKLRVPIVAG